MLERAGHNDFNLLCQEEGLHAEAQLLDSCGEPCAPVPIRADTPLRGKALRYSSVAILFLLGVACLRCAPWGGSSGVRAGVLGSVSEHVVGFVAAGNGGFYGGASVGDVKSLQGWPDWISEAYAFIQTQPAPSNVNQGNPKLGFGLQEMIEDCPSLPADGGPGEASWAPWTEPGPNSRYRKPEGTTIKEWYWGPGTSVPYHNTEAQLIPPEDQFDVLQRENKRISDGEAAMLKRMATWRFRHRISTGLQAASKATQPVEDTTHAAKVMMLWTALVPFEKNPLYMGLSQADKDGDNSVTLKEYQEYVVENADHYDMRVFEKDADGVPKKGGKILGCYPPTGKRAYPWERFGSVKDWKTLGRVAPKWIQAHDYSNYDEVPCNAMPQHPQQATKFGISVSLKGSKYGFAPYNAPYDDKAGLRACPSRSDLTPEQIKAGTAPKPADLDQISIQWWIMCPDGDEDFSKRTWSVKSTSDSTGRLHVTNKCKYDVWIQGPQPLPPGAVTPPPPPGGAAPVDLFAKPRRLSKGGSETDFMIPDATGWHGRLVPTVGCDEQGQYCDTCIKEGASENCMMTSGLAFTENGFWSLTHWNPGYPPADNFDVSAVDGYRVPMSLLISNAKEHTQCYDTVAAHLDAEVLCPTDELLAPGLM